MASFNDQKKQQNEEEAEALSTLATAELAAVWERISYAASHAPMAPEDRVDVPLDALFHLTSLAAHEFGMTLDDFLEEMKTHFNDNAGTTIEEDPEADEPVSVSIKTAPVLQPMRTAQEIIDEAPEP